VFLDLASSSSKSRSALAKDALARLGVFRKGRVCRYEGVLARPVPVLAGTELATFGLLGLFSLGMRRDGVLESGVREFGVAMVKAVEEV
jgi:hypothetical protein